MNSDIAAVAAPIGVAILDYAAGRPAETGDLVVQIVLLVLTLAFGATKSAPLQAVLRLLTMTLPGLIKAWVANGLANYKQGGK